MEGITREKVGAAPGKEQPCHKKPFYVMAPPPLKPTSRASSSFQPKPNNMNLGDAGGSNSSAAKSCPRASSYLAQAANKNNKRVENPTADNPSKKTPIPTRGTTSAAATDDQAQLAKLVSGRNFDPDMDPKKLKRIISNRQSAERARKKKIQYITDLEEQAKTLEDQIVALRPQVAFYTNQKQFLISEQNTLEQQLAALEKGKFLKDAEIEKSRAELNMLKEAQMMQEGQFRAPKFNWNAGLQPISSYPNSNLYENSNPGNMGLKFFGKDILLQTQQKQDKKRAPDSIPDPVRSFEETNFAPLQQKRRMDEDNPSSSRVECINISTATEDTNRAARDQVEVGNAIAAASVGVVTQTQEKGKGQDITFRLDGPLLNLDAITNFTIDPEDWESCSLWDKPYPVGNFTDKHLSAPIDLDKYKRVGGQGLSVWVEANALRIASIFRANQKEFHAMKCYIASLKEKIRSAASVHAEEKETLKQQIAGLEGLIGLVRTLGENLTMAQERISSLEADASKLPGAMKRAEIAEKEVEQIRKSNEELTRKVIHMVKQVKEGAKTMKSLEQSWKKMKYEIGNWFLDV